MIQTIRHVGIVVKSIDDVLPFYRDLLNLKIVKKNDEPENFINSLLKLTNCQLITVKLATENGETLIELLEFISHPGTMQDNREIFTRGISHIALTVKNLDLVYTKLFKAGIQFFSPPLTSPDGLARVTFCRDPAGNYLELVEEL